jgi:hypothetical protein
MIVVVETKRRDYRGRVEHQRNGSGENIFVRQFAQVASSRAEGPDAGQGRLLALVPARRGRSRTNLVLQGFVDELRNVDGALARYSSHPRKQVAFNLDACRVADAHALTVAALSPLSEWLDGLPTPGPRDGGSAYRSISTLPNT